MSTNINAKSFGIVIYMGNVEYSENSLDNVNIHMKHDKKRTILGMFQHWYENGILLNACIMDVVIGHEHGEENRKCHYQIFIQLNKKIDRNFKPGEFRLDNTDYLYMSQKCRTPAAYKNYCKKDGDFIELMPGENIKTILKSENLLDELENVDDPYKEVMLRNNLSDNEITNIFKTCEITEFRKDFMNNSKKILDTYHRLFKTENKEIPEFHWRFPQHILDYLENSIDRNSEKYIALNAIHCWYKKYCILNQTNVVRRKSLFLFSLKGGVGKSYFARSLVPEISVGNSPYYVYCRGTLDGGEFERKKNDAKLVILDDINYISNDLEIWKALTVSEPTNIRSPYHNTPWLKSLPCILMSNNIKTLKYWIDAEDLKTRCVFVCINFFLGPPGTDSEEHHRSDEYLTCDVMEKLDKSNEKKSSLFNIFS